MNAQPQTASVPGISPAIRGRAAVALARADASRASTGRFVLIAGSFLIEAMIVVGFTASSLGLAATPYPEPGPIGIAPPASISPVPTTAPLPSRAHVHDPAPEPAPEPELR